MSLDPNKLSRFGGSKVRTGCLTCVRRRIKCDENYHSSLDGQHHSCQRCLKAGRECQRRLQGISTSPQLRVVHYGSPLTRSLNNWPDEDGLELRSIEYFKSRTAPELAGMHNPELWSHLVMQAAHAEPAIRAATVALGSLHEQFEANALAKSISKAPEYPLQKYGRAIKLLCESIQTGNASSQDTPLLACALFSAFESMGFHIYSALSHVLSGLKVIGEAKVKENWGNAYTIRTHNTRTSLRLLFPLFTRLDTQRVELGDASFSGDQPLTIRRWKNMFAPLTDLHELRYHFDNMLNDLIHHIKVGEDHKGVSIFEPDVSKYPAISGVRYSVSAFLHWTHSFDDLVASTIPAKDVPSCLLLQSWRLIINILLRHGEEGDQVGFDRFKVEFELIVKLSAEFLCWTIRYKGAFEDLLMEPSLSPFDEILPAALREICLTSDKYHSQLNDDGFVHNNSEVNEEARLAIQTARNLLLISGRGRTQIEDWSSSRECFEHGISPRFTFSHGIIYPLYVVMIRCRHPDIRRKAWTLLHRCGRREGLWDSKVAARLGQTVIQIEEYHALRCTDQPEQELASGHDRKIESCTQIPNSARISELRSTFVSNAKSRVRYYFACPDSSEDPPGGKEIWIEEVMEW